ncbi:7386_t:CDS:2, partial [Cetraspora pellucida]
MDQNECIQNDQSICNNCKSDHENDANDQSDQELVLSNNNKKSKIIIKSKSSFKSSWLNEFKWLQYDKVSHSVKKYAFSDQYIDAIKLDNAEKTIDKESGQLTQQCTNHIIRVIKIIYTLIKQDIPLAKLLYFVQMSHELESLFIIDSLITYENEKEIRESVSFGIMIDE